MESSRPTHQYAFILMFLLGLFVLRVIGQLLVVFLHVGWLPPLQQWQSGLLPYPVLLSSQIAIIVLFTKICRDLVLGKGLFFGSHRKAAAVLNKIGSFYLLSMIVRYIVWMSLNPDARWFGGTIPIIFHCILASFLIVLSNFYLARKPFATVFQPIPQRLAQIDS
jgi:hypothetical protein